MAVLAEGSACLAGMFLFHHKTRHKKFTIGIPVILVAEAALLTLFLLWHYSTISYQEDPVKLVRHELSILRNTDSSTVDQELSYEDLFPSEDTDKTISKELREVFSSFFADFRYKILDVKKQDGQAFVTVRLTTLDGEDLARENIPGHFIQSDPEFRYPQRRGIFSGGLLSAAVFRTGTRLL